MSDTDHSRMPGTNRAWARQDRYPEDWEGELAPRRVKAAPPKKREIDEGVAEYKEAGLPWWDRSIRWARRQQRLNDLNNWLLDSLLDYQPHDAEHLNLIDMPTWERNLLGHV